MKRLFVALVLASLLCPLASAHASIKHSEPEAGARMEQAPDAIRLVLTQPVDRDTLVLKVTDQEGRRVDQDDVRVTAGNEPVVTASLEPDLPDGAYLITLTATSLSDSHRITYTVGFAVGGFMPPTSTAGGQEHVEAVPALARAVAYAGLALLIGGLALGWRLQAHEHLVGSVRLGAALYALGTGALLDASRRAQDHSWSGFFQSEIGALLGWRGAAAGLVLATVLAFPPHHARRAAWAAVATVPAILTTARFTHASSQGPLAILNDAAHIVAASVWVGGLLLLVWLWRDRQRDALADARAFSTPALVAVGAIAATGVLATVMIIEPGLWRSPQLMASPYGRFLASKVTLALAMVAIAAVNRYVLLAAPGESLAWLRKAVRNGPRWLRPAHSPGAEPRTGLNRLVAAEAGLGVVVLLLAGLLLSVSPPDPTAQDAEAEGLRVAGAGSDFLVTAFLSPEPDAGATSDLRFFVQYQPDHPDAPGEPVRNDTCGREGCVHVRVEGLNGTVDETRTAVPEGGGWWALEGIVWPRAGAYTLTVEVQTEWVFRDAIPLSVQVP